MKQFACFIACCIACTVSATAQTNAPQRTTVFTGGEEGFNTYRIPSVITTSNGTVLAFAEGRQSRCDQSENKIVLKRSTSDGKSWLPLQIIADGGKASLNNPCAVIEQQSGRIWLMFQSYPAGVGEFSKDLQPGCEGASIARVLVIHSDDEGKTWSQPTDITSSCKRPTKVTTLASGPGIGIQLQHEPHMGRMLIQFNEGPPHLWNVYAVYSDDKGETWKLGECAPGAHVPGAKGALLSLVNETQLVERSDGSVMLNSRRWAGKRLRKTALSENGGVTWSKIAEDPVLRDPGCMASVFRYSFDKSVILYSGPDSAERRTGAIRVSYDEGKNWPIKKVLEPGRFAYSCLTRLADGQIGCLYETGVKDSYEKIVFATFPLNWLAPPTK